LGRPGYIAPDDVRGLVDQGQVIGSHTITHRLLPTLSDAELNKELTDSRDRLANIAGHAIEWFAPPGGHYDSRSPRAAHEAGYRFFRTMDWGYAPPLQFVDAQRILPTVPVLRNMSERRLEDVLHGRARFPGFVIKQFARRILPESIYYRLRDWAMAAKR
jgi:peptidoglycan/xylan/chitin deacetylase (PgdA/CDA1 family)